MKSKNNNFKFEIVGGFEECGEQYYDEAGDIAGAIEKVADILEAWDNDEWEEETGLKEEELPDFEIFVYAYCGEWYQTVGFLKTSRDSFRRVFKEFGGNYLSYAKWNLS